MRNILITLAMLVLLVAPADARSKTTADGATMPSCSASDPVVWINTKSNVYHVKGDKYFGTTKAGKYACTSAAVTAGARAAKASHMGDGTAAADAMPTDAPGKKHKKHKAAEPMPSPT